MNKEYKEKLRKELAIILEALQDIQNPFCPRHVETMISKAIVCELKHIASQYYNNIDTIILELKDKEE